MTEEQQLALALQMSVAGTMDGNGEGAELASMDTAPSQPVTKLTHSVFSQSVQCIFSP